MVDFTGAVGADQGDDLARQALPRRCPSQRLDAAVGYMQGLLPDFKHRPPPPRYASMTRWIVLDLLRRTLRDELAEVQHVDAVGNLHNQIHVVLDHENSQIECHSGSRSMNSVSSMGLLGIHAGSRLVQQQQRAPARWPGHGRSPAGAARHRAGRWPAHSGRQSSPTIIQQLARSPPACSASSSALFRRKVAVKTLLSAHACAWQSGYYQIRSGSSTDGYSGRCGRCPAW